MKHPIPPAFILGMGQNGLGVARSLGRAGIPLVGVDCRRNGIGFSSRYCSRKAVLSHPEENPEQSLEGLMALGRGLERKGVLIPTVDYYVSFIARWRHELSRHFVFNIPAAPVLERIVDKRRQYEWAAELGIPIARSFLPADPSELPAILETSAFPLLVKGASSNAWHDAFKNKGVVVRDRSRLLEVLNAAWGLGLGVVVQELVLGPNRNHFKVCAYYTAGRELLALFSVHKVRQYPVDFGVGTFMVSIRQDELISLGRRFFEGVGYTGVGSIEFKRDDRDGRFKLIELNPRLWLQHEHAVHAGLNFPLLNYRDCLGEAVEPALEFREHVAWLNFLQDVRSFLGNRSSGESGLISWLCSIASARSFAYFALDDPWPSWSNSHYGLQFIAPLLHPGKLFRALSAGGSRHGSLTRGGGGGAAA